MRQNCFVQASVVFCCILQQVCGASSAMAASPPVAEADERMVANCQFLGTVRGTNTWGLLGGGEGGAMKGALKKAKEKGATNIVWGTVGIEPSGVFVATGKAYQCSQVGANSQTAVNPAVSQSTNPVSSLAAATTPQKQDVYKTARDITVLIEGDGSASGVIIAKSGQTYYVLTAKHAVTNVKTYTVIVGDSKTYAVAYSQIRPLANLDLAIIPFSSSQTYAIANLGNSDRVNQGDNVYVSGWPGTEQAITKRTHLVTDGRIVGLQKGDGDGYELMYGNSTAPGMSGGPVLDTSGRIVGIHGRAAGNQVSGKVGINLGIPINLFLQMAPQSGLSIQKLGLKSGI
jgi:S1-C subfamily serine protease